MIIPKSWGVGDREDTVGICKTQWGNYRAGPCYYLFDWLLSFAGNISVYGIVYPSTKMFSLK